MTTNTSADLASLDRVAHRLALLDSADKLTQVLEKLLPRLLKRIGNNKDAQIHDKLVEMISHILKRVRGDSSVKLQRSMRYDKRSMKPWQPMDCDPPLLEGGRCLGSLKRV